MKPPKPLLHLVLYTAFFSIFFVRSFAQTCPTLVWQDEFSGTSIDPAKWNVVIGDGCPSLCGWGNNELQSYQAANVVVSDGTLKITARKETVGGRNYTSGRLDTKDLFSHGYGRFEARMKLPNAKGLWPAFWMLSQTEPYGTWPKSGEIDVMEFVPVTSTKQTLGYIHYGDFWPNNKSTGKVYTMPIDLSTDFHVWAVEWEANVIRWYIDGVLFSTKTNTDISPSAWPFDHPFYMLLNMAVGGNLGGAVTDSMLPATMEVDYVRVYTGTKPSLSGENSVANAAQGIVYTVNNMPSGTTVNWTVPSGATIVSGQGTNSITVNFGTTNGDVVASYLDACTNSTVNLTLPVGIQAAYTKDFSFENFDAAALITQTTPTTGTFTDNFANPLPSSTVNNSALVGKYVRNAGEQYDVLYYNFNTPLSASAYKSGAKRFYMDVYTTAPVGTVITLQLETSAATAINYPTGRYARFTATTTSNTGWQRLAFDFLDSPDAGAASTATKMVFLFNANSYTNDTYYFDNFDSYNNSTVATEPLTAAPTPTPLPANVISLFSNAYTNVAVDTWSAVWDVADVTDVQVAGNATKKYTNLTYAGVEFTSPTVNATTMERFHMDVWSLDAATFNVKLVDFGANGVYGGGDDTEHELSFSPTLAGWFSIDVPLSNFTGMTSRAHVAQLIIVGPGGGKTVWVDNVYFYKLPPTEPLTAAPTPTKSAPNVISLFSNPYTNVAVDTWSAVWDVADVTDVQVAGNATKKYTNLTYAGIEFTSPTVNATTMESFHMDVWSLDAATFNVKLVDFGANGVYGGGDDTEHELSFTPTLNEWFSIDVPLSSFTGMTSRAHVAQLIIVGPGGGKTVWVDNVYFYKTCQANGTLNDNPVVSGTYLFSSTITSQGKINAGSNVTFSAGNSVTLNPGFQANSSSVFSAQIGGCTN
ncbi:glycoside hydrolase family 16 (plasmid) [Emticicia oligotrophica DSM 17448]|uniref:Glycoside hydrolase family 16 n=1 Tax=Emticicia oligotrophica (strain DSM 17448 / CIP 109782 / MTCC 6937 / GPTSA100-15) TaxID=929562 RepID=A0ABN4ATH1_EMTOG|nr:family 16 glycosylhydrolase [Emticicia oligotrophica]AFK05685.1 glycoside hydrolase family 16 [Emticicia oligotrophica DSM 17448]